MDAILPAPAGAPQSAPDEPVRGQRWGVAREARVALVGAGLVLAALAAAVIAPLWLLAIGPIVLGVPHVVSDVRYLCARPGFHRRKLLWLAAGVPIVWGIANASVLGGLVAAAGAAAVARGDRARRAAAFTIALGLAAVAWSVGSKADVAFAHLHNFLAVALWWAWRPRIQRWHWIPLGLFAGGTVALLAGLAEPVMRATAGLTTPAAWPSFARHVASLAPVSSPTLGVRIVLLYAFAQAVHYAVWLRLVPTEERGERAASTWSQSMTGAVRSLRADVGVPVLILAALSALAIALWAVVDLSRARTEYLRFAIFHGHLELVAVAIFFVEGWPARGPRARSIRTAPDISRAATAPADAPPPHP
jgi:hypothetical protein